MQSRAVLQNVVASCVLSSVRRVVLRRAKARRQEAAPCTVTLLRYAVISVQMRPDAAAWCKPPSVLPKAGSCRPGQVTHCPSMHYLLVSFGLQLLRRGP